MKQANTKATEAAHAFTRFEVLKIEITGRFPVYCHDTRTIEYTKSAVFEEGASPGAPRLLIYRHLRFNRGANLYAIRQIRCGTGTGMPY